MEGWKRAAIIAAAVAIVVLAFAVLWPGDLELLVKDLIFNLVRAFCAVTMLMMLLKHWTAKIAGSLPPIEEDGRPRPQRFADWFRTVATSGLGLAVLLGLGMVTFGQVVIAVWK